MAKKKATLNEAVPAAYEPPTRIKVTKAQAGQVSVGDRIQVTIAGEVTGVTQCSSYGDTPKSYELELKKSKVSGLSYNKADRELRKMMGK